MHRLNVLRKSLFQMVTCTLLAITALSVVSCAKEPQPAPPNSAATEAPATAMPPPAASGELALTVYKSPTCGCCGEWVEHMEAAGFNAQVHDQNDLSAIKQQHGITPKTQSCHTAISNGYVFEGHVPAKLVKQFLAAPPKDALGLAVPGMPIGSPGMEMGERFDPYDVLVVNRDGSTAVYAHISAP